MATSNVEVEDTFLKHVSRVREEIGIKFARAHQALAEREAELTSELQLIEERYTGEGIDERTQLFHLIQEMKRLNEMPTEEKSKYPIVEKLSKLDARASKISSDWKKSRACMGSVELEWDRELEARLGGIGIIKLSAIPDYKEIRDPVIVACEHNDEISHSPGVFKWPRSIAIDSETCKVYICDWGNNRVQVFNKSLQFLFDFSEKMSFPQDICISQDRVYVTQNLAHCLNVYTLKGEFLKSVGGKGTENLEFDCCWGVAASEHKNRIYICDNGNSRIQCLNLNLTFNSIISDIPKPLDVKLPPEGIVVLTEGDFCIHYYNYTHELVRRIIPSKEDGHAIIPYNFCLDTYHNILMTDWSTDRVLIYSSEGELVHRFGGKGEGRGEFIHPRGIAVDSESRIVVASENTNHCLQKF